MLLTVFVPILIGLALVSSQKNANKPGCNVEEGDDELFACRYIDTFQDLKSQLSSCSDKETPSTLTLTGIKEIPHFPDDEVADFISLHTLKLSNMTLPFWKAPPNRGKKYQKYFNSLEKFELDSIRGVHNWDWQEVKEYFGSSPRVISIENSRWPRLPSHMALFYDENLEDLSFKNCNLKWLDDGSLNCPKCATIDLSNNDIKDLRGTIFGTGPEKLTLLDLSNNKLKELPADLFDFMETKKIDDFVTLNFKKNKISSFIKETFKPFLDAKPKNVLKINDDKDTFILDCNCDDKWLLGLDLSHNKCMDSTSGSPKQISLDKFLEGCK